MLLIAFFVPHSSSSFFRIYGKKPVELTDKEEIIQLFNEKLQEEEEEK